MPFNAGAGWKAELQVAKESQAKMAALLNLIELMIAMMLLVRSITVKME